MNSSSDILSNEPRDDDENEELPQLGMSGSPTTPANLDEDAVRGFNLVAPDAALQASWMPRFGQSAELSNMNEIPSHTQEFNGSCWSRCGQTLTDAWTAVHDKFYFQDPKLEADYLVYYLQNRAAPLCLVIILLCIASLSALAFIQSFTLSSLICRCIAFTASLSSMIGAVILQRENTQLLREELALKAEDEEIDGGVKRSNSNAAFTKSTGNANQRPQRSFQQGPSLARRQSFELHDLYERKRKNAARQEIVMLWCNVGFYVGSLSFYFIKAQCLGGGTVCLSGIYVDGTVVFAYLSSACVCRARFLHHAAHIITATALYLTIRSTIPTSQGFPTYATQYFLATICCVLGAFTIATIWFVERAERWFFFAQTLAEKRRVESNELARYCKAIASSMMPSHVVVRLSQGSTYIDHVPRGAVCAISFVSADSQVYKQLSPHELVQILQHGAVTLDSCLTRIAAEMRRTSSNNRATPAENASSSSVATLTKVHSTGDCYMVACSATDSSLEPCSGDSDSQHHTLEGILRFLRMFVSSWILNNTVDNQLMSVLSLSFNNEFVKPFVATAAVDVGEIFLTAAGRLSFIALGCAARNVQNLVNFTSGSMKQSVHSSEESKRAEPPLGCCSGASNRNNCVMHVRFSNTAAALMPLCSHKLPVPSSHERHPSATVEETTELHPSAPTVEISAVEWCSLPTPPSEKTTKTQTPSSSSAANPLDAVAWFLISSSQPRTVTPPAESNQAADCFVVTYTTFHCTAGVASSTRASLFFPTTTATSTSSSAPTQQTETSPFGRRSRSEMTVHSGSVVGSYSALHSLRLTTTWGVFPTFEVDSTEQSFRKFAETSTVDNDRSRWEFFFLNCVMTMILALVSADGGFEGIAFSAHEAVFWLVIALASSLSGTIMLFFTTDTFALVVLRVFEFVCFASFIAAAFVADQSTPFGSSGGIIWLAILAAAVAARERRQGLGFLFLIMLVVTIAFTIRSWRLNSPRMLLLGDIASQGAVLVGAVAGLTLLDRFRREQYADERSLEILEKAYAEHATSLQQMLEAMIPSKVVDRLMMRHTAAVAASSAVAGGDKFTNHTAMISFMGKTHGYRGACVGGRRLRTRNLWQSPFTTTSEDSPILLIRVFPSATRRGERKFVENHVAVTDEACRVIGGVLRNFDSLAMVKVCGASMMIADQSETNETTDKCLRLSEAIGILMRSLKAAGILSSAAITVGPMVGAIVGTVAITFEYFGQAPALCSALLDSIQPGEVVATGRFVEFVKLSYQLRPSSLSQEPPTSSIAPPQLTEHSAWSSGDTVEPPMTVALRRFGKIVVHRIVVAAGETIRRASVETFL